MHQEGSILTHGQTPTARCQGTRAVRLALETLGEDGAELKEVWSRAMEHRPQLGPRRVMRILERLARDGEVAIIAPGIYALRALTAEQRDLARAHRDRERAAKQVDTSARARDIDRFRRGRA